MTPDAAPESLRAFIAVEIDPEGAQRAAEVVERLRTADAGRVKWVDPANFHLTLKFLGPTRRDALPQLGEALRAIAAEAAPFEMELFGAGAFPNLRRPQVIWLGVTKGSELLAALAGQVEAACAGLGWAREEKPYRAHLTLGRLREPRRGGRSASHDSGHRGAAAVEGLPECRLQSALGAAPGEERHPKQTEVCTPASSESGRWPGSLGSALQAERDTNAGVTTARRLVLMESQLGLKGPTYTVIEPFPLRGAAE